MKTVEEILDDKCDMFMIQWDIERFKHDYPRLFNSILHAMEEYASQFKQIAEQPEVTDEDEFAKIKFEIAKIQFNYLKVNDNAIEANPATHRIALWVQSLLENERKASKT